MNPKGPAESDFEYNGEALLREQASLLSSSSARDIHATQYLRLKLAAQQRRNHWQRQPQGGLDGAESVPDTSRTDYGSVDNNSISFPLLSQLDGSSQLDTRRASFATSSIDDVPAVASGYRAQDPEVEDVLLIPCVYCGRRFAADRIERHCVACGKQAGASDRLRKQKAAQQRTQAAASAGGAGGASGLESVGGSGEWRRQSSQLRGALNGEPVEDLRVPCPYCRRRFASETAARHIPLCKEKGMRMR